MVKKLAAGIACCIAIATLAGPAAAQDAGDDRRLELVAAQSAATQQLAKDALLVALGFNQQQILDRLERSRAQFDRILQGLRHGDSLLGLVPPSDIALVNEIDQATVLWQQLDAEIQAGLAVAGFTPEQVDRIADLNTPLLGTMDDVRSIIADNRGGGQVFSMLLIAIEQSDRQRILVERITKELLLIAYGHDVAVNRALLQQSAIEFDETLADLIEGNLDRLLLPAPTPAIRHQLAEVEQSWRSDLEPIVNMAIDGHALDRRTVGRVAEISTRLFEQSNQVVTLYQRL